MENSPFSKLSLNLRLKIYSYHLADSVPVNLHVDTAAGVRAIDPPRARPAPSGPLPREARIRTCKRVRLFAVCRAFHAEARALYLKLNCFTFHIDSWEAGTTGAVAAWLARFGPPAPGTPAHRPMCVGLSVASVRAEARMPDWRGGVRPAMRLFDRRTPVWLLCVPDPPLPDGDAAVRLPPVAQGICLRADLRAPRTAMHRLVLQYLSLRRGLGPADQARLAVMFDAIYRWLLEVLRAP